MINSRGMGAVLPSKMPKKRTITRKDDPNKVGVFAAGGVVIGDPPKPRALPPRVSTKKTKLFKV